MQITNVSGGALTNYPMQFGRPFVQGEIANYPQVLVGGSPTATQADVKNRHTDGSVKYAVLSLIIPSLPSATPVEFTFQNQASGNNTPLSTAQMLGAGYDFDVQLVADFPAAVQGVPNATVGSWTPITNGSLAWTYDGTPYEVTGMNFSGAASYDAIAAIIVAAFASAIAGPTIPAMRVSMTRVPQVTLHFSRLGGPHNGGSHTIALATPSTGTNISSLLFASSVVTLASSSQTVSARAMLSADKYTTWASGQIAQTIELADDTTGRAYDIGNADGFHPLRPRFYATFWPALNKVNIRVYAETGLSMEFSDLWYAATVKTGSASPATVFTADLSGGTNNKYHWAATAWTKRNLWIGTQPSAMVNVKHNVGYIASTKATLNYDPAITLLGSTVTTLYNAYILKNNGIYDGKWNGGSLVEFAMANAGGRPDLGVIPQWCAQWLYSGDWRMREISLTYADIYAAEPMHILEIQTGRRLNRTDAPGSSGLGHYASGADRKTMRFLGIQGLVDSVVLPGDAFAYSGPVSMAPFTWDGAHQPSAFYLPYLFEGDPYYLREMYVWASVAAIKYNRRGPTGAEGGIEDEPRGTGRVFKNRVYASAASPDSYPEKAFFGQLILDAIGKFEEVVRVYGTALDGTPVKVYQATYGDWAAGGLNPGAMVPPPVLGNWEANSANLNSLVIEGIAKDGLFTSWFTVWMQHHIIEGLAIGLEQGFPTEALLTHTGTLYYIDGILNSGYPKIILGGKWITTTGPAGTGPVNPVIASPYFATWAEEMDAMDETYKTTGIASYWASNEQNPDRQIAASPGMAAFVNMGLTGASTSWAWFDTNVYQVAASNGHFADIPVYAIRPRSP